MVNKNAEEKQGSNVAKKEVKNDKPAPIPKLLPPPKPPVIKVEKP